jgi:hypothetical protein
MGDVRNAYSIFIGRPRGKRQLGRPWGKQQEKLK